MFRKSARFYDAIYSFKDYEAEAIEVRDLIKARKPDASTLLDVACGTGLHLQHLANSFEVEGIDLDPGLLEVARERLPDVALHEGDMRDFSLGKKFDAITCLFSSIGYVGGPDGLRTTAQRFAEHLIPGGVLIVEGWLTPDEFTEGHLGAVFVDQPDLKIARMNLTELDGRMSKLLFRYLVGTPEEITTFDEMHEAYLFTQEEYLDAFRSAGIKAEVVDALMGRGVYVGVRG